jgi:UDP-4-amino-4,6-dideoxy-N-acetyl-beta-L-altrosamine N-acetyltransferase
MKNRKLISWKEHLEFLERLSSSVHSGYYAVIAKDEIIGAIYLTQIDYKTHSASLGLYKKPAALKGTGTILMRLVEFLAVEKFGLSLLRLEVRVKNTAAIELYRKFGFNDHECVDGFLYMEKRYRNRLKFGSK